MGHVAYFYRQSGLSFGACSQSASLNASIHELPSRRLLGNCREDAERYSSPQNRATMSSTMPIVPTFHTSERISGTPAA